VTLERDALSHRSPRGREARSAILMPAAVAVNGRHEATGRAPRVGGDADLVPVGIGQSAEADTRDLLHWPK
jgi:hypothetical protein